MQAKRSRARISRNARSGDETRPRRGGWAKENTHPLSKLARLRQWRPFRFVSASLKASSAELQASLASGRAAEEGHRTSYATLTATGLQNLYKQRIERCSSEEVLDRVTMRIVDEQQRLGWIQREQRKRGADG